MMVILAAKLILHANQSLAFIRTFICDTVWSQSMAFLHVKMYENPVIFFSAT